MNIETEIFQKLYVWELFHVLTYAPGLFEHFSGDLKTYFASWCFFGQDGAGWIVLNSNLPALKLEDYSSSLQWESRVIWAQA